MAPMLGITDSCFRSAFTQCFGGFDLGISPFIRTLQGRRYKASSVNDLHDQYNNELIVQPQIMSNQADDFVHLASHLFDMGYHTINFNMGCPVPTAAGRARGAGLIKELDRVDRLLDHVFENIPNRLSVKTRIGLDHDNELLPMIKVFNRYPLHEVMIHPRTAKQKYNGSVNHDAFHSACKALDHQVVYSGDLFSKEAFDHAVKRHPYINKWMFGRGILWDPYLLQKIRGENFSVNPAQKNEFLLSLVDLYRRKGLSDHIILTKIKTILFYFGVGFGYPRSVIRGFRKSRKVDDLLRLSMNVVY